MTSLFRFPQFTSVLAAIALLSCMHVGAQTAANGKTYTLARLTVKGPSHFGSDEIAAAGGLKKGQQVDLSGLDAATDRIFKTGAIAKIGYSYTFAGDSIFVEFQVSDASRFLPCLYDNFVWFSDAELTAAIHREVPLFDGSAPVGGDMMDHVSAALEHFLQEHKISGTVTATMNGKLGAPVSGYTLQVNGVPMPVVSIGVSGGPLGPEVLAAASQMHVGPNFSRTLASGSGQFGLMEAYQNEGYLQTKFSDPQISLKDPQDGNASAGIAVNYTVTPGPRYNWNGVTWNGNQSLPEATLMKLLQFTIGDIAGRNKVNAGWSAVQDAYGNVGYLEIQVIGKPEFDAPQHQVHFQASITEGPQYQMGEFAVSGVSEPLASKLKAAWKLHPGDVFDKSYGKAFLASGMSDVMRASPPGRPLKVGLNSKMNTQTHVVDVELQFR